MRGAVVTVVVIGGAIFLGPRLTTKSSGHAVAPPPLTVDVSVPVERKIGTRLQFLGEFSAVERVELRAQVGGTLTQLTASLGTPYAFDPPEGCILFVDEIGERPFRIDRMLTQLRLSGILQRAAGLVFNELPKCDEPTGSPTARAVVADVLTGFPGPIVFGMRSGHTAGAMLTLPFGVRARVVTGAEPGLVIEEAAVE